VAILPNGDIASGSKDKTIRIWDPMNGSGAAKRNLIGHADFVNALAVLPNGDLASGSAFPENK
jgi:WD40 repeat protein